jgi:hypothetical protein
MAVSQFKVYRSTDASAPSLTGNAGSLITVLDACLINGYGTQTAPSPAWTHPVVTASNIASYKQPSGSGLAVVINDNGPNGTSLGKEAWATGWESVAGVGSPVGSGTNQFPTAAQLLTSGHVVIRKSTATGATVRDWVVLADSSTFYLFVLTGDTAGMYYGFMFGDIYSLNATTDSYRCMIIGRDLENSALVADEGMDKLSALASAVVGNFMARSYTAAAGSITVGKHGDATKGSAATLLGTMVYPNPQDAELYATPIWVVENGGPSVRGRLRGLYQVLHAISSFTDGQSMVANTGDFNGKTFLFIKQTANAGIYLMEVSNTVETN